MELSVKMHTLTAFTGLMLIAFGNGVSVTCPDGYVNLTTNCYRFTTEYDIDWYKAFFICRHRLDGYLVEIDTPEEQDALKAHILGVVDPSIMYDWWTGGADILREGDYIWMTSGNATTYQNWDRTTEPNDASPGEDCIGISANLDCKWRDLRCNIGTFKDRIFRAICEAEPVVTN